jgi:hypothetical protein
MAAEGKGFAEQTGRRRHGKPKCRQGYAISGNRVAPPEKEEGNRRRYGEPQAGHVAITGRKKKGTMKQGRALREDAPTQNALSPVARYIDETVQYCTV